MSEEENQVEVEQVEEEEVDFASLSKRKQRKYKYRKKLIDCLTTYKSCLIVSVDNVGSKQMQKVRGALRGKGIVLMGKNTLMRKVVREVAEDKPDLELLIPYIKGNMGLIFSNENLNDVRKIVLENKVPAAARTGAIAPVDVWVPEGPTGLDPGQTAFFQALSIATKIARGSIEIINKVHLIKKGDKVTSSAVALLGKLNIKPFFYGIMVNQVFEAGTIYDASILDLTDDDLTAKWYNGVRHVAAVSFAIGIPSEANYAHIIINSFRKLCALALEVGYEFEALTALQSAAPSGGGGDDSDEEEEEEEEEEEDESSDSAIGGGLFG